MTDVLTPLFDEPGLALALPGVRLTPTSAAVDGPLTPDHATTLFRALDATSTSLNWWIGDLTIAAMTQVRSGDREMTLVEPPADQPNTARCVLVAERIEPDRRRCELTWSHHSEVAGLPPDQQDRLLDTAVVERLSVRGLRAVIDQEHEDMNPRLPGVVWEPKWPSVRAIRSLLDEAGDTAWVLWQPATGEFHRAPADMIERAS